MCVGTYSLCVIKVTQECFLLRFVIGAAILQTKILTGMCADKCGSILLLSSYFKRYVKKLNKVRIF
jgi:hypothetical protein